MDTMAQKQQKKKKKNHEDFMVEENLENYAFFFLTNRGTSNARKENYYARRNRKYMSICIQIEKIMKAKGEYKE